MFIVLQIRKKQLIDIKRPTYLYFILFKDILLFKIWSLYFFFKNLNCHVTVFDLIYIENIVLCKNLKHAFQN